MFSAFLPTSINRPQPKTDVYYEGWVQKRGRSFMPTWTKRFLVLTTNALHYYSDEAKSDLKGEYILTADTSVVSDENTPKFTLNGASGQFLIEAPDINLQAMWVSMISQVIERISSNHDESKNVVVERKPSTKEGWVEKLGRSVRTWKRRYLVLEDNILTYYTDSNYLEKKGEYTLQANSIVQDDNIDGVFQFTITCDGDWFSVRAIDAENKEDWIISIDSAIDKACGATKQRQDSKFQETADMRNVDRASVVSYYQPEPEVVAELQQGWVEKLGSSVRNWKRRYLVLKENALSYYTGEDCSEIKGQ
jgi:hypothetical protein